MIGGDVNFFIDCISYGEEVVFSYKGQEVFMQGIHTDDGVLGYELFFNGPEDGEPKYELFGQEPETDELYIWKKYGSKKVYPLKEFLEAKIFEGKTFFEVEREITWLD